MNKIPGLGEVLNEDVKEYEIVVIEEVINVTPVKFDGVKGEYIVCPQNKADTMAIVMNDEEGQRVTLLLPIGRTKNTCLLADAMMEG